jgi:hypothetical protein
MQLGLEFFSGGIQKLDTICVSLLKNLYQFNRSYEVFFSNAKHFFLSYLLGFGSLVRSNPEWVSFEIVNPTDSR